MTVLKSIPSGDKRYLNPEASYNDYMVLSNRRVYYCVESASEFLFAGWERVTFWRHPVKYLRILSRVIVS